MSNLRMGKTVLKKSVKNLEWQIVSSVDGNTICSISCGLNFRDFKKQAEMVQDALEKFLK